MMPDERRTPTYRIARARIRMAHRVRYDMDVLDRIDVIETLDRALVVVHTSTGNAGIFTHSDVWELSNASSLPPSIPPPSILPPSIRAPVTLVLDRCR
jgi:hypothetical protein